MTNDPGAEGAEKRTEKWGHWAKACWALVVMEARSEWDPYSSWQSVSTS